MLTLVFGRGDNTLIVEFLHYPAVSLTADIHIEYHSHHRSSFRINNKMVLVGRVDIVAIGRKRADKLSLFTLICESSADLCGNILDVHFIVGACEKPHGAVTFAFGIGIVGNSDESDSPFEKSVIDVLFNYDRITGKSGLILAKNDIDIALFAVAQQAEKLRAAAVNAAVTVIHVYIINFPVTFMAVITEHRPLILYALTVIIGGLVFVLDGQSAVYTNFRHFVSSLI